MGINRKEGSVSMDREDYRNLGYQILAERLSKDDVRLLQKILVDWKAEDTFLSSYGIIQNNIYKDLSIFREMMKKYRLGALACELLDIPEIVLFQDNLIWKPPQTPKPVQWHQDYSYWPLSAPSGVIFWIALDDVYKENGALSYIPQSERWGECRAMNFITDGEMDGQEDLPSLPWKEHAHEQVIMEIEAGQILAHHPLLAHMSYPNLSQFSRRAWSLMYITPDVCWDTKHAAHPYPVFHSVKNGATLEGDDFPRFQR